MEERHLQNVEAKIALTLYRAHLGCDIEVQFTKIEREAVS